MLTIATAQSGTGSSSPPALVPIVVAWGAAMVVIGLEDDIGFAALLFALFHRDAVGRDGTRRLPGLRRRLFGGGPSRGALLRRASPPVETEWLNPADGDRPQQDGAPAAARPVRVPGPAGGGHGLGPRQRQRARSSHDRHDLRRHRHGMGLVGARRSSSPSCCWSVPASASRRRPARTSPG